MVSSGLDADGSSFPRAVGSALEGGDALLHGASCADGEPERPFGRRLCDLSLRACSAEKSPASAARASFTTRADGARRMIPANPGFAVDVAQQRSQPLVLTPHDSAREPSRRKNHIAIRMARHFLNTRLVPTIADRRVVVQGCMSDLFRARAIVLTAKERGELESLARSTKTEHRARFKARIVLMAADGAATRAIARALGCTIGAASKWRVRYAKDRIAGFTEVGDRGARAPGLSGILCAGPY
jgi:transposase-like protein